VATFTDIGCLARRNSICHDDFFVNYATHTRPDPLADIFATLDAVRPALLCVLSGLAAIEEMHYGAPRVMRQRIEAPGSVNAN
jgi:hypothetical protein